MGFRKLRRNCNSLSIIILLIFSQIISTSDSVYNSDKPLDVNTAAYGCYDFLVSNNKIYALSSLRLDILDISNPSKPIDKTVNETLRHNKPRTITKEENTILFASGDPPNSNLYAIQLDEDENKVTEVAYWDYDISKMVLKNKTLFSMAWINETRVFTIHNVIDIENIQLLGSTNTSYYHGYYRNEYIPDYYFIHENHCYVITEEGNLTIYQINNTYQLSFVEEYNFTNLRNLYFTEENLFTCDEMGMEIYNYSDIENMLLIKQYNIPNARSVQVRNETAYLITDEQFVTLDVSNLGEIRLLDQYLLGKRESIKLMKIEMKDNLAIVMTEKLYSDAIGYTGYLYIFDITDPISIKRIYPVRIPLNHYRLQIVFAVFFYGGPPILITAIVAIIIRRRNRKQRNEKISYKSSNDDKPP